MRRDPAVSIEPLRHAGGETVGRNEYVEKGPMSEQDR